MLACLYVYDGFADWEPAHAVAGLNNPQFQREPGRWSVLTAARSAGGVVRSMGGVAVLPDRALADIEPAAGDLLLLPGGPGWEEGGDDAPHAAAIVAAQRWHAAGAVVAAICGATAGLARAGLLDERPHTSNAASYLAGTGYAGGDHYVDDAAVDADGLITAGGMAPLEFARAIFQRVGLYSDEALDAWYALYKTGKSDQFAKLRRAAEGDGAG